MQWLSNKSSYGLIVLLTLLRGLLARTRPCPADFDCNSYIAMAEAITYNPDIAGHHAMRILPSVIAGLLQQLGLPLELAFRLLSVMGYSAFGLSIFWLLQKLSVRPLLALSFTLLCLAAHPIIIMPLKLVYQTCDMWTYPLVALMFYCSIKQHSKTLLFLSLLGILVRQNLFILGVSSLLYCYSQSRHIRQLCYLGLLVICYGVLQSYYHATSTFSSLLQPPEGYFTVSHLWFVITDSKVVELFIPLLPFLILYAKELVLSLWRYWHITLYMAITAGQPVLGYHMTGNNLTRLSLQGIICLYLLAALASVKHKWSSMQQGLLLAYAFAMYITWGNASRLVILAVFSVLFVISLLRNQTASASPALEKA